MGQNDTFLSREIMTTYYAQSSFPTDEELRALGIDPTRVSSIHGGPDTPLPVFQAQVKTVLEDILTREQEEAPLPLSEREDLDNKQKPAS